jgi:SAM-dependent methyltransferase
VAAPKKIVEAGFDELRSRYADWTLTVDPPHRLDYFHLLSEGLPIHSRILELGCGPGTPVGEAIAKAGHHYFGLDLSRKQLDIARENIPGGRFIRGDMTEVDFQPGSFDAVAAFYSIFHVPREQHAKLFDRISRWLRPGGLFVASLGAKDNPGGVDEWIDGVPMYWSGFDAETNIQLIESAGLQLLRHDVLMNFEDNQEVMFLWVLGRKSGE